MDFKMVLSIITIFVTIIVPIGIYLRSRTKKRLSYSLSSSTLISDGQEFRDKLHITVGEQKVTGEVYLVLLKIINDGNVPIRAEDFFEKLTIETEGNLLIAELKDTSPQNLSVNLEKWEEITNEIEIEPLLLNSGDELTFKILSTSNEENIHVSSRIAGVKDINKYTPPVITNKDKRTIFGIGFLSLLSLLYFFNTGLPVDGTLKAVFIAIISLPMSLSLFAFGVFFVLKRKRDQPFDMNKGIN